MLKSAFESLGNFFSSAFLLAFFLPALLVLILNIVLYMLAVEGLKDSLTFVREQLKLTSLASTSGLLALGALFFAFLAAPFSGAMRSLLAGTLFLSPLRKPLEAENQEEVERLEAAIVAARGWLDGLRAMLAETEPRLQGARATPRRQRRIRNPAAIEAAVALMANVSSRLDAARDEFRTREKLPQLIADLRATADALETALETNNAALKADLAQALNKAHFQFGAAIEEAILLAAGLLQRASLELRERFDPEDVHPTRFGNYQAVMQAYSHRAYGVHYGFVAPRLDLALVATDGFTVLDRARIQLESALTFFFLFALSLVVWLVTLAVNGVHLTVFLSMAVAGPFLLLFLYEFAVQAQKALGERFQAALDANRFAILSQLHIKLPTSDTLERAQWQMVQDQVEGVRNLGLAYNHPAAATVI
jgi:hypothetical protein